MLQKQYFFQIQSKPPGKMREKDSREHSKDCPSLVHPHQDIQKCHGEAHVFRKREYNILNFGYVEVSG